MSADLGERLKSVRKRRGLTQPELATASGVSLSLIRKVEQGERSDVRLATLRKLAIGLRVRTSDLQVDRDAEHADAETVDLWGPVRRALAGQVEPSDEPVTLDDVGGAFDELRPMLDGHRYRDISVLLPPLLRDADTLTGQDGRAIRARVLSMAGHALCQNRQFDAATNALDRAIDASVDRGSAVSAVNVMVWTLLRQGRLAEGRDLAIRWADDIEPRFSRATFSQIAGWGRLWMYVANSAARDNRPGEMEDALALARAAAERIGREAVYTPIPERTFGPVTVAHTTAECAAIIEEPARTLAIAEAEVPTAVAPNAASRLRHRLDVASAHAQLRQYGEAVAEIQQLRVRAPEWLTQQRYARDVLGRVVTERRTLTPEMRELADFVKLEY
jgi:transcriptional regulator with XRE-family HTH domain